MQKHVIHILGGAVIFFLSSMGLFQTATTEARLHRKLVDLGEEMAKANTEAYTMYTIFLGLGLYFIIQGVLGIIKEVNKKLNEQNHSHFNPN